MSVEITTTGNIANIALSGDFDFSHQESLQAAFEEALKHKPDQIEFDFASVTFIDSSVIRMLLKLSDAAQRNKASLAIVHCSERIREIFVIGGFDQIFKIT
jgi:anti-anti-sigma factor